MAILVTHEDAARDAGLHPHTVRRQLETAMEAYHQAVNSSAIAAIKAAEERANALAADIAVSLAHGVLRLIEEERRRAPEGESKTGASDQTPPDAP